MRAFSICVIVTLERCGFSVVALLIIVWLYDGENKLRKSVLHLVINPWVVLA